MPPPPPPHTTHHNTPHQQHTTKHNTHNTQTITIATHVSLSTHSPAATMQQSAMLGRSVTNTPSMCRVRCSSGAPGERCLAGEDHTIHQSAVCCASAACSSATLNERIQHHTCSIQLYSALPLSLCVVCAGVFSVVLWCYCCCARVVVVSSLAPTHSPEQPQQPQGAPAHQCTASRSSSSSSDWRHASAKEHNSCGRRHGHAGSPGCTQSTGRGI